MRTRTVVERIGEWLGPVDWSYDFQQHAMTSTCGGCAQWAIDDGIEQLRRLESEPGGWWIAPSGFTSFEVVHVGMYDGWPFWQPTPAVGYIGPLGGVEVAFFYNLRGDRLHRRLGQPTDVIPEGDE